MAEPLAVRARGLALAAPTFFFAAVFLGLFLGLLGALGPDPLASLPATEAVRLVPAFLAGDFDRPLLPAAFPFAGALALAVRAPATIVFQIAKRHHFIINVSLLPWWLG